MFSAMGVRKIKRKEKTQNNNLSLNTAYVLLFTKSPQTQGAKWGQIQNKKRSQSPFWLLFAWKNTRNQWFQVSFWLRRWDLNLTTSGLWARRATKLLYSAIFCWVLTRKGYYITLLFFCQPLFCFLCKNSYFLLFCCPCSTIICAFSWYIHVFCKVLPGSKRSLTHKRDSTDMQLSVKHLTFGQSGSTNLT